MGIKERIKALAEEQKISLPQLEQDLGFGNSTIVKWDKSVPNVSKLAKVADYFGVSMDFLTGRDVHSSNPNAVRIPVLGRVAAGIPLDAVEEILDWEEIPADQVRSGEYFALKIKGNSMSPRIMNGDVVIVRKQDDAESDEIVIALVNGNDGCCKKLRKTETGLMLISLNPAYEPMVFTQTDIDEIPVRIIGKVVELRGKL